MSDTPASTKPSRRDFLGVAAATGAAIAATGTDAALEAQAPGAATPAAGQSQDLFLTNGRIHTLDGTNRVVSRLHIHNNRIAAVGDRLARPAGARVIDLKGRIVVPGLVEPHVHIVSLANRPGYHTILENTASIKEVQQEL